jgi:hypothetical protein
MKRVLFCGLAGAVGLVVCGAAAAGPYSPPRNGLGQPDLSGAWSNATLTPQVRNPLYGARRALTPDEVRLWEGANAQKDAAASAKTDASAGVGGASDNVGAYDRAWIDNGTGVMRVNGEPRTSLITTSDGQPPPGKGQPAHTLAAGAGSAEAGLKAV